MSQWWTYRLSDFLMFSPQTYARLVESYNRELWPGPLVAWAAGLAAVALATRNGLAPRRALAIVLAAAWAWVAWAFHAHRYAAIFLAGPHLAAIFALQALLFLLLACFPEADQGQAGTPVRRVGVLIACVGVLGYPLLAPALGHPWRQAEVFGWMPDPTALATVGLVIASGLRAPRMPRWIAVVLPGLVLFLGAATQWELARR